MNEEVSRDMTCHVIETSHDDDAVEIVLFALFVSWFVLYFVTSVVSKFMRKR